MAAEFVNLYALLREAGCELDNHESDLYVRATPEARAIVEASGYTFTTFRSVIDRAEWLDVPFAFYPFWEARGASWEGV